MNLRPKTISSVLSLIASTALISGCSNLSGLDASNNYSCPAPPGVVCKPMSEVYRTRSGPPVADNTNVRADSASTKTAMRTTMPATSFLPGETRPLRSQPKVLRIWVAPYEDTDGDLHEEHRMYLQVDAGRWMVEHHRARIQNAFTPPRAPSTSTNAQSKSSVRAPELPEPPQSTRPDTTDAFDSPSDTNTGAAR